MIESIGTFIIWAAFIVFVVAVIISGLYRRLDQIIKNGEKLIEQNDEILNTHKKCDEKEK